VWRSGRRQREAAPDPDRDIEIQQQAVDLDEKMFGVAAPMVGLWQRQLNELGGVKSLAFGQYGELGPGFEQLLDQLAEGGADEAARRSLPRPQPRSSEGIEALAAAAAGGDGSPKSTGGSPLPSPSLRATGVGHARGGEARCARRGRTATSMRTTTLASTEWAARSIRAGRVVSAGRRRRLCARPCCAWAPSTKNKKRH
jgi:hypothetical protein